jgi:hypothetical protein
MCNVGLIFTKLLVQEIGATLMEFLKLDDAMENVRRMHDVICRKLSTFANIVLKMCRKHVVGF